MKFQQEKRPLSQISADALVIGIYQDEAPSEMLVNLDPSFPKEFAESVGGIAKREDFKAKPGQSLYLPTYGKIASQYLVLAGLGKGAERLTNTPRKAAASVLRKLTAKASCNSVAFELRGDDVAWVQAAAEGCLLGSYTFLKYKAFKNDDKKPVSPDSIFIVQKRLAEELFKGAVEAGAAIGEAVNFARDLIAEPAGVMTPTTLAAAAAELKKDGAGCEILEAADAERMGMGAFLGVASGASQPPKFIILSYKHEKAKRTIGIAGKGITFDSGGLSLKTAAGMEHMKYDMSGAAAVIAVVKAICKLKPAINLVAVAAATENMPGMNATHPGDVLKAMNGKTIEVNNTDAEGRLVLADCLSYLCANVRPDEIIDIATLTGGVVTALGRTAAGIMGTDNKLVELVISAGAEAGEKLWQLPLYDEYKEALKSDIADLKNAGARGEALSSCAGMFLKEFVDGKPWAHLDIAGPGWSEKEKDEINKGGTAFGVRTLCYYLLSQASET
jgi:leucyl aminopeptidase